MGDAILVNTHLPGNQSSPQVEELANGDIGFWWSSDGQDQSSYGAFQTLSQVNPVTLTDFDANNDFEQIDFSDLASFTTFDDSLGVGGSPGAAILRWGVNSEVDEGLAVKPLAA